jgi:prepilin-type N-terminal cleavage/methylation domain-containing protein
MKPTGFTLIELVMVIVVLAILGAVAIPVFVNLRQEAVEANEMGVAGAVRAGIANFFIDPARGNRTTYPPVLDNAVNGMCSTANPCFTNILAQGGVTDTWFKKGDFPGFSGYGSANPGNVTNWIYRPATGEFVKE